MPESLKLEVLELSLVFLSFYSKNLHLKWLPVFQSLLPCIPLHIVKSRIIPEIMILADFTRKQMTRQISCHLLANVAEIIGKEFKGALLQRVKALSQDTNPEVREEMAKAWLVIVKALGRTAFEETIYFDMLKLIEDEVEAVKCNGMLLFINSLSLVSDTFFNKEIVHIIPNYFYNTSEKVEEIISENVGVFIAGCHGQFRNENLKLIKKFLSKDCAYRQRIAFNFPGIVQCLSLCNELREVALSLSADNDIATKITFAAGFHEVIALHRHCKVLRKISSTIVEDPDTKEVVFKRLRNWSSIIEPSQLLIKFIRFLTQNLDWRTQVEALNNFEQCIDVFSRFLFRSLYIQ